MLSVKERFRIMLLFIALGPVVGGLPIALASLGTSNTAINHILTFFIILLYSYPFGFIPALISGFLAQWMVGRRVQQSLSLSGTKSFLLGAFTGLLSACMVALILFEAFLHEWRNGRLAIWLFMLVPFVLAGGVCMLVALQRLKKKRREISAAELPDTSLRPLT